MASNLFRGVNHASLYSKFRPSPPQELINSILNYLQNKVNCTLKQAVDIGCGSGQSTVVLAPYFEKVIGFDISESQISCAQRERSVPNVEYKIDDCEKLPLPDASVQLVTSSQAVHWFDTEKLFAEVKRILIPNGVVAVYGYWIPFPKTGKKGKDNKIMQLIEEEVHEKQLGHYWNIERLIVKNYYRDISFPFKDVQRFEMTHKSECSLAEYIGYLSTWSAYHKVYNENINKAQRILKDFENEFLQIVGPTKTPEEKFALHTDFFMLIGHS